MPKKKSKKSARKKTKKTKKKISTKTARPMKKKMTFLRKLFWIAIFTVIFIILHNFLSIYIGETHILSAIFFIAGLLGIAVFVILLVLFVISLLKKAVKK